MATRRTTWKAFKSFWVNVARDEPDEPFLLLSFEALDDKTLGVMAKPDEMEALGRTLIRAAKHVRKKHREGA